MGEPDWHRYRTEIADSTDENSRSQSWAWKTSRFWVIACSVAAVTIGWMVVWVNTESGPTPPFYVVPIGAALCYAMPRFAGAISAGQVVGLLGSFFAAFSPAADRNPEGTEAYIFAIGLTYMAVPTVVALNWIAWWLGRHHQRAG